MHTRYSGFADAQGFIDGHAAEVLRLRVGARWFTHGVSASDGGIRHYVVANLLRDLMNTRAVTVAGTPVKERFSRASGELGLGLQRNLRDGGYLYADARYRHSLDTLHSRGFQLNVGMKQAF